MKPARTSVRIATIIEPYMANNNDPGEMPERMVSGEPQPEDEGALDRALRPPI